MLNQVFEATFLTGLLVGMLRLVTPILFAAIGLLVVERGGIVDLSPEGVMLMGALFGFTTTFVTGSLWLGIVGSMVTGALIGLLSAFLIVTLKMNQSVSGIAVNLLASGLSFYLFRVIYGESGDTVPTVQTFDMVPIPLLSKIPVIGQAIFSQYALTYIAFAMVIVVWFFLYKTKYGLIIRSMGENPRTVDMKGINVSRLQTLLLVFGGMMYAVAGAFLTLVSTGLYVPDISAGRGWIAVALVIFGRFKPIPVMLGALMFGFLDSFQLQVQSLGVDIPHQLLLTLPYLLTIIVLVTGGKGSGKPLHLGIPYRRE